MTANAEQITDPCVKAMKLEEENDHSSSQTMQLKVEIVDCSPKTKPNEEENKISAIEKDTNSETWKINGFPNYYKTGHVKRIMQDLGLSCIDVFKKSPNTNAFVRFVSKDEKVRAQSLINNYTAKKIKKLHCIPHPNRSQFTNILKKRAKMKSDIFPKLRNKKKMNNVQEIIPKTIMDVVTPLHKLNIQTKNIILLSLKK